MDGLIWLVIGFFVGGTAGFVTMSLLAINNMNRMHDEATELRGKLSELEAKAKAAKETKAAKAMQKEVQAHD